MGHDLSVLTSKREHDRLFGIIKGSSLARNHPKTYHRALRSLDSRRAFDPGIIDTMVMSVPKDMRFQLRIDFMNWGKQNQPAETPGKLSNRGHRPNPRIRSTNRAFAPAQ